MGITILLAALFSQTITTPALAQENLVIAVSGVLMRGLELESSLINLGATIISENRTELAYRLYSITDEIMVHWV
ncbi:MAG TPA: hypothetical protein VFY64_11775 [Nitrososphaeraceae archaeon]|nr:hypothetical protein [Nitrososphaeraceae archaeon]